MSGFSAEWLALRESYDLRARNGDIVSAVITGLADRPMLRIVDLASGTGATLRAVAPHLPAQQMWRLVDNDLSLLARAAETKHPSNVQVVATPVDLAHDLEAALDGPIDLVTTSALLDLVSGPWLERLAVEIAARRLPFYAALTYDGRADLRPPAQLDRQVIEAVNAHQRRDKGFGPALGPDAARTASARFTAVGYQITAGASDWRFGPDDRAIQLAIVEGWAGAAIETGKLSLDQVAGWLADRRARIKQGEASMVVGHMDFLAAPGSPS